jgi:hypothetical protein
VEKAWAKLSGSYEASEMGISGEFFESFLGLPNFTYWTEDYENNDIGLEKLFKILKRADKKDWIMTGSVLKSRKEWMKKLKHEGNDDSYLKKVGLRNNHSYTLIDIREVTLENG